MKEEGDRELGRKRRRDIKDDIRRKGKERVTERENGKKKEENKR